MKRNRSRSWSASAAPFFPVELQRRAAAFLARSIPPELQPDYVADSLAERVISCAARNEALDPDLREIAEMAAGDYAGLIAGAQSAELKTYYAESRSLLAEIVGCTG